MLFCMSQDILASANNRDEELSMKGESTLKDNQIGVAELMSDHNDGQQVKANVAATNEDTADGSPMSPAKMNRK